MNDTASFIQEAIRVHGTTYDYSRSVYINRRDRLIIICPEHGEFKQSPASHLRGSKCPICAKSRFAKLRKTTASAIAELEIVHAGKGYDFSNVVYVTHAEKVHVVCPDHGSFYERPSLLLKGKGCPACSELNRGGRRLIPLDEMISRAKTIHKTKFDYSLITEYHGVRTPIKLRCIKHDHVFGITMNRHVNATEGCPKCRQENARNYR
jgi:Zn finger protein HypA/HybF involved in hydrogenase expression